MKYIGKKEENNLNYAPIAAHISQTTLYYNCSKCTSLIEILSINDDNNIIEFKCLNKLNNHSKKIITIGEYLKKMDKYNDKQINDQICTKHNNKYLCFCFNCNKNLCNKCLKERIHINLIIYNILEVEP